MKIETNLSWQYRVNDCSTNLNRTNGLLFKMRKYVSLEILRCIYFAIFWLFLNLTIVFYGLAIRAPLNELWFYEKKAIKIINFQTRNFHTSPLFKQNSIIKFQGKICSENILLLSKSINNLSLSVFNTWFSFFSDQHN